MRLQACAKVNLFLRVVGRRADGYHEIETVYQSVSLCDAVTLEPAPEAWDPAHPTLSCDDPTVPADHTNLAWRAAVALAELAALAAHSAQHTAHSTQRGRRESPRGCALCAVRCE